MPREWLVRLDCLGTISAFRHTSAARETATDTVAAALRASDLAPLEVPATKLFLERQERLTGQKLDEELRRLKRHLSAHFAKADALIGEWTRMSWL